jgi:hypothetical protein
MIRIKVTQEHINKGRRRACRQCPVALAIVEQTEFPNPWVGDTHVDLVTSPESPSYKLPAEVQRFIDNFDNGKPVKPFAFNLKI